jgi:hypothetical protein
MNKVFYIDFDTYVNGAGETPDEPGSRHIGVHYPDIQSRAFQKDHLFG